MQLWAKPESSARAAHSSYWAMSPALLCSSSLQPNPNVFLIPFRRAQISATWSPNYFFFKTTRKITLFVDTVIDVFLLGGQRGRVLMRVYMVKLNPSEDSRALARSPALHTGIYMQKAHEGLKYKRVSLLVFSSRHQGKFLMLLLHWSWKNSVSLFYSFTGF